MKKNSTIFLQLLLSILGLCVASTGQLYAYGVGFYTSGNVGRSLFGINPIPVNIDDNGNPVDYRIGCGFVYDSAVASNDRLNYRLNAGYENGVNGGSPFFSSRSTHQVTLSNTFGFALFKSKYARVWMGPQVELACQFGERSWNSYYASSPGYGICKVATHVKIVSENIGLGGVLGINMHSGDLFTLGLEAGISTTLVIMQYQRTERRISVILSPTNLPIRLSAPINESKNHISMNVNGFTRINFIFRVGDTYIAETPHTPDVNVQ